jgi:peptide/nickel transport system substrate-binding protein
LPNKEDNGMARPTTGGTATLSRRAFLSTTSAALAGATALGLAGEADAGKRHPKRGGTLRFATRGDTSSLDFHRTPFYPVSQPLAAICQGLLDLNLKSEPVPGVAYAWEAAKDLLTYTFKLRKGILFHNHSEVDAAAIKWNFARIQNPKKSSAFARSALANLKETVVLDKYTVQCHLHQPSAAFPANVVFYPCSLMAPDEEARAKEFPISCGPFKFVRWERYQITVLERFENYYETDAEGNALPYLGGVIGRPKKEDRVRLTSLRTGEVDLIDNMAYADAQRFPKQYAKKFQTWDVPMLGTMFAIFNLDKGPFTDKRLRQAAAHAIDHEAIKQAVFYGRGDTATGFYGPQSPWYSAAVKPYPAYDPDKAKFLLRQARAEGTTVDLQSSVAYPYMHQTGELLQAMLTEVGFHAVHNIYERSVLRQKRRERDFHLTIGSASYRFDPDGWFSRSLLSTSPSTKQSSGFKNERVDTLIAEARKAADRQQRLALYGEIDSIVNDELPILYLHHLTLLEAGVMNLRGYQPGISGPFTVRQGGLRTAWMV